MTGSQEEATLSSLHTCWFPRSRDVTILWMVSIEIMTLFRQDYTEGPGEKHAWCATGKVLATQYTAMSGILCID